MLKQQYFGIEIETTGITRQQAATAIANYFLAKGQQARATYIGGEYDTWEIDTPIGKFKAVSDSSIRHTGNGVAEVVSPKLRYEDIETLQEIVRAIRKAGAKSSSKYQCGIHVHVDAANHTPQSLKNLVAIMRSKENILYRALNIEDRERWCKKVETEVWDRIKATKATDFKAIEDAWYGQHSGGALTDHYHKSRYHGLNLHNVWFRGTVEFRLFNGTLHAGEIKSYIQLCLAISAQAITQKSASGERTTSTNEKYTFRTWLLRLGLIGDEFKTAREHLLKNLEGNSAWRNRVSA
jgi:hypothetical protein